MRKYLLLLVAGLAILGIILMVPPSGLAAEKLRFANSVKDSPRYILPVLAAEEKGFWKQQGLEVQWLSFSAGPLMYQAVAAGSVDMGFSAPFLLVTAVSAGVPVIVVGATLPKEDFFLYVPQASPIKEKKELKGTRMGITRLGGAAYAYARLTAKVLDMEKDITFVATGGITPSMAALRAGQIHGVVADLFSMGPMVGRKEIRPIVAMGDYMPKPWISHIIVATKDMTGKRPEVVRRAVRAFFQTTAFVDNNPAWAMEKMISATGYSKEGAQAIYPEMRYGGPVRIERAAMENVRNFMIEYGLLTKEKAPPAGELFTNEFIP